MTERIKKDFIAKWLYRISRKAGSGKIGCFFDKLYFKRCWTVDPDGMNAAIERVDEYLAMREEQKKIKAYYERMEAMNHAADQNN